MSEENLQLVREGFVAMERGDVEALVAISDPEVEWINPEYAVEPGTRRGPEGFRKAVRATHEIFDEVKFEIEEMIEVGDRVVATGTMMARGKGSGLEVAQSFGIVFTIREGRLIRFQWFRDPSEARAAAESADEVPERDAAS
jgi:ketosteroid isomerase-like protein